MPQGHLLSYVHSSFIYNNQKIERTQMSLNGGMDTENVVYLHNGVLHSNQKQWIHEILRQMVGTGKYHPKWGNSFTKECTWNAVTDKWILAQKLWVPKTQLTYQIIPKRKEEEGPGPGKAWCSIVGDYQDREVGEGWLGKGKGKRAMGRMGRGKQERENHFKCKQRI